MRKLVWAALLTICATGWNTKYARADEGALEENLKKARKLEGEGRHNEALQEYEKVLQEYEKIRAAAAAAILGKGRCHEAAKQWQKAQECYEKLIGAFADTSAATEAERRLRTVEAKLLPQKLLERLNAAVEESKRGRVMDPSLIAALAGVRGAAKKAAGPKLRRILADTRSCSNAVFAMLGIGVLDDKESIPAIVNVLKTRRARFKEDAAVREVEIWGAIVADAITGNKQLRSMKDVNAMVKKDDVRQKTLDEILARLGREPEPGRLKAALDTRARLGVTLSRLWSHVDKLWVPVVQSAGEAGERELIASLLCAGYYASTQTNRETLDHFVRTYEKKDKKLVTVVFIRFIERHVDRWKYMYRSRIAKLEELAGAKFWPKPESENYAFRSEGETRHIAETCTAWLAKNKRRYAGEIRTVNRIIKEK